MKKKTQNKKEEKSLTQKSQAEINNKKIKKEKCIERNRKTDYKFKEFPDIEPMENIYDLLERDWTDIDVDSEWDEETIKNWEEKMNS